MQIIEFKGERYPGFQAFGNAAQFAIPYAKYFCNGLGYDIGCSKLEWALPGAIPIDLEFKNPWDANNLPDDEVDYIFSSHCLEHVPDWVATMDYWYSRLKVGGTLFLYLPDYSQKYWRPWNNRRHKHCLKPEFIRDYMIDKGYDNVFVSGVDLNNAFMAMGEK